MWEWGFKSSGCQYVRVVKEADSKSVGVTRAGSNPAADVFFYLCYKQGVEYKAKIKKEEKD